VLPGEKENFSFSFAFHQGLSTISFVRRGEVRIGNCLF